MNRPASSVLYWLLPVVLLAVAGDSRAFINRSYSTLQEARPFDGDFVDILNQGKLRILVSRDFTRSSELPRRRSPLAEQQRIAEEFALSHGLTPELIIVDNFAELIPALEAGHGDIAVDNLTINDRRLERISFSVPVDHVVEQVVVATGDDSIARVRDLNGKRVMVNRDSTFWHALVWLRENRYPEIEILEIPDRMATEALLDRIAGGDIDATVMDSNLVESYLAYRDDIRVAVDFSGQRDIGWGVRKNAPQLLSEINRYLQLDHGTGEDDERFVGDFDAIKERRVLRVLLRNNSASYFIFRGELMGFEYELARDFAEYHGLRLEVVVPPSHRELTEWLREGHADIALGFIVPDDEARARGIAFSEPYHYAAQHVVVAADDDADSLEDLDHYSVFVRHHSAGWERLSELKRQGAGFVLRATDDATETEQLIDLVAGGKLKATLADKHLLDIELAKGVAVRSALALEGEDAHAIALRAGNPELKKALDLFVDKVYRGELYNVLYRKYFESRGSIRRLARGRVVDPLNGTLSPYDEIVRKYADRYGFDWRLITAQMYQESKFDPRARSHVGASGLMQLMPRTARELGIEKPYDPASSIRGGIQYLDWLRDRFEPELTIADRLWFTLAAYNAGAGHVRDARRLAARLGLDPNRWFDHTEQAMLLLSQRKYAARARYGYVDGRQPVNYVRNIRERFEAYLDLSRAVASIPDARPSPAPGVGMAAVSGIVGASTDPRLTR